MVGSTIDTTKDTTVKALQGVRDIGKEATGTVTEVVTGVIHGGGGSGR